MAADSRTPPSGSRSPADPGSRFAALRWIPWWAVGLSALVILSANFAVEPIRDASNLQPVNGVQMVVSSGYLLLAPICNVFDTLSLMSLGQHVAILVTLVVLFAAWRLWRARRRGARLWGEVNAVALGLAALVAVYAAAILVPRPMAAMAVNAPFSDVLVVVDFHSHTNYSHDGAPWFTPEANRRWHREAGFDAAYITDHRTVAGAEAGLAKNPPLAGEGTTLLQGLEVVWDQAHVNLLGAERSYRGVTDPNLRDIDDSSLTLASLIPGHEPIVVYTFPNLLRHLHPPRGPGTPGARAMELLDGSPRGLGDSRRKRTVIAAIADTLDLALVAGSDNHGWGYTAPGWTLLQIRGWREMNADGLAAAIDQTIRNRKFEATQVVERREANTSNTAWRRAATAPLVAWRMLTMLSDNERVSWLIWIWAIVLVRFAWRRRKPGAATAAA